MTDSTIRMKRITKNTLLLFVRMLVLTIVNLYAVRLLLGGLGKSDYGLFNAIAGVVMMSSCIVPVLSQAVQRFYSYLSGKGRFDQLQEVFSTSVNIIFITCLLLIVIFETIGVWFVNTQMNIPTDRIYAANIIFQFATVSFFTTLLQIPYTAAIFAHEDMNVFAYVSCLDCLLKLLSALLIGLSPFDNLISYSFCLMISSMVVLSTYYSYTRRKYQECNYIRLKSTRYYSRILSFTGWSMLGSLAGVGLIQGSTILLNIFFGPIINAAFAIAISIYNAMLALGNCIILAFRPQMIKSYAVDDYKALNTLFSVSNKCILYLLAIVSIPLYMELERVLDIWLGDVTNETVLFVKLMLIYTICLSISSPITTIIQATGRIKHYYVFCDSMTLMHLPIAFILLKFNLPSESVLYSMIGVALIAHFIRIIVLKKEYIQFSMKTYLFEFMFRGAIIIAISTILSLSIKDILNNSIGGHIVSILFSIMLTTTLSIVFGTNVNERMQILSIVKKLIRK